jgi:hypothetical protein
LKDDWQAGLSWHEGAVDFNFSAGMAASCQERTSRTRSDWTTLSLPRASLGRYHERARWQRDAALRLDHLLLSGFNEVIGVGFAQFPLRSPTGRSAP